jgi:hypothetical protein
MYTGENLLMTAKESRNDSSDATSEQSLELRTVFKEASIGLITILLSQGILIV